MSSIYRTVSWLISLMLTFAVVVSATEGTDAIQARSSKTVTMLAEGNNQFGLNLYQKMCKEEGNMVFSPFSIFVALQMTLAGAKGVTAHQMRETLQLSPELKNLNAGMKKYLASVTSVIEGQKLSVANSLWGHKDYDFRASYINVIRDNYMGEVSRLDFSEGASVSRMINEWISGKTNGKITNVIGPEAINPDTPLVLVNAIYFLSKWLNQFSKYSTQDAPFYLSADQKVSVPTMNLADDFEYMQTLGAQVLAMPYEGGRFSMVLVLPGVGGELGLRLVESNFLSRWDSLKANLKLLTPMRVAVSLPKFKVTSPVVRLNDTLQSLGMTDAFDSGLADLTNMAPQRELFVGQVAHKAYIDVNESGTEAAAATVVIIGRTSVPPQPRAVFKADHPFVFMIWDRQTDTILFVGRVVNPQS